MSIKYTMIASFLFRCGFNNFDIVPALSESVDQTVFALVGRKWLRVVLNMQVVQHIVWVPFGCNR